MVPLASPKQFTGLLLVGDGISLTGNAGIALSTIGLAISGASSTGDTISVPFLRLISGTPADNSIMTTTPSVADVLGGPGTGLPGVFPDQIALAHNTTVRHHLNHMPDPVIRPGGWPFSSWFPTGAPQAADRHQFDPSELELTVTAASDRIALGQPLDLSWTMTNRGAVPLIDPNDVRIEALFAAITATDAEGRERPVRPFTILCESAKLDVPGVMYDAGKRESPTPTGRPSG